MGRNATPIELHVLNGNPTRLTKAEIEARQEGKIDIDQKDFRASALVRARPSAIKEFRRLKRLYKDVSFITSLDEHLINQYCLSVAELEDLLYILDIARECLMTDGIEAGLEYAKIDYRVQQKRQEIVRLSDRLYLNPVARSKNVPAKAKKETRKSTDLFA